MKKNSRVSVIIPNYNHANFLKQRLESIFNQTYQNFEVILLDDASTDGSVEILRHYSSYPKVSHFIINDSNSGSPFRQWQKGIALAKGDYIWIAESDDMNELNFLDVCMNQLLSDLNIGLMATGIIQFNQTGETGRVAAFNKGVYFGNDINIENLSKGNCFINASSVVFKRSLIDKEMLRILNRFKICGDWWLWVNILNKSNLGYTDKFLTRYRKHEGATTFNLWNNSLFYREVRLITSKLFFWHSFKKDKKDKIITYWTSKIQESSLSGIQRLYLKYNFYLLYPTEDLFRKISQKAKNFFSRKELL